jgi:hypothetical protein
VSWPTNEILVFAVLRGLHLSGSGCGQQITSKEIPANFKTAGFGHESIEFAFTAVTI